MLARNQNSSWPNLDFPINVASDLEVEGQDKKIRLKQTDTRKRPRLELHFL